MSDEENKPVDETAADANADQASAADQADASTDNGVGADSTEAKPEESTEV